MQGKLVQNYAEAKDPGDFFFSDPNPLEENMMRLSFICPCGCGDLAGIRVREDGQEDGKAWSWNKDRSKPTCRPSVAIYNNHWHGYLTDGEFTLEIK